MLETAEERIKTIGVLIGELSKLRPAKLPPTEEETSLARKRFDQQLWPGAWRQLVRDAKKRPFSKLLRKYKKETAACLSWWYLKISGGEKKPVVASKKLARPDVTVAKVRRLVEKGKLNAAQIARALKTDPQTIRQRAENAGVKLGNGLKALKRPEVTPRRIRRLRKNGWKFREIAEKFDVNIVTIFRRVSPQNGQKKRLAA